jgi:hypothetical protein
MILEILVVAAFRHVHVDCALGQTSTNVEVHSHVCCSNLIGFGLRSRRACQLNILTDCLSSSLRNGVSGKATVAHSVLTPSLDLSTFSSSCQHIDALRIVSYAFKSAVVDGGLAVAAEDFEPEDCRDAARHDDTQDDDAEVRRLLCRTGTSLAP